MFILLRDGKVRKKSHPLIQPSGYNLAHEWSQDKQLIVKHDQSRPLYPKFTRFSGFFLYVLDDIYSREKETFYIFMIRSSFATWNEVPA